MSGQIDNSPYELETDTNGDLVSVRRRADRASIPIDSMDREYCKFITWAANQTVQVARGFLYLERGCEYYGHEDDVIAYCRRNSIVLFCHDFVGDGKFHLETGMNEVVSRGFVHLWHAQGKAANPADPTGRYYLYRLYKAVPAGEGQVRVNVDGLSGARLPIVVTHTLLYKLQKLLDDENSDIRRLSSWPVRRTFVYVDVSGFSQHPVGQQLLIINSLIDITNDDQWWPRHRLYADPRKQREANLCIGDGYIFAFHSSSDAVYFAAHLAALIESLIAREMLVEFHFRISVHTGPVYRFWDRLSAGQNDGRWNYVGRGITDGERVLSAIGKDRDDVVFVSAETRKEILAASHSHLAAEVAELLQNRGRQADKHGVFRRLYELNHTAWLGSEVGQDVERIRMSNAKPASTTHGTAPIAPPSPAKPPP